MPEPLTDFAYNMLVGLDPNAILLTNGDNDTYPLVALQACRGFRKDVAVLNLSLLNLGWYRRDWRNDRLAVPVPLLDQDPRNKTQSLPAVKGLIDNLRKSGWKRPLYVATTVELSYYKIPNKLSLEGIVYRVLPRNGEGWEVDTMRLARNLGSVYRLQSATSPALDWKTWSGLQMLVRNYVAADLNLCAARAKAKDMAGVRECMVRSLTLCEFQGSDFTRELISQWSQMDPRSPELARWKKKLAL